MEKITYKDQANCLKLTNGIVDVIVATDFGPRILFYGFTGAENILGEHPDAKVTTELGEWKAWGGHRLWTAPEASPRSYAPDNQPVEFVIENENSLRLVQRAEPPTNIEKEIIVTLDEVGSGLTVAHQIRNRNLWGIEVAPWALTIMNGGGVCLFPQEPYRSWDEYLLPARQLVLWHYTDLSDSRWTLGKKFLRLKSDAEQSAPQKIGLANKQNWAAYHRQQTLFIKRFVYEEGATYPDFGSNNETYTAGSFIELETLAPLQRLEIGASATHEERWSLFNDVGIGATDDDTEAALTPCLSQISK